MAGRGVGNVGGGLGRSFAGRGIGGPQSGGRRNGDRVDQGIASKGSVYPRKGKGWGVQGEAAYPDLLDRWDREAQWQSWRKGMALARSQLIGAAERWSALEVLHRDSYAATPTWRHSKLLLAGFSSPLSPEGRWTVAIQPRGTEITRQPVGSNQKEFWYHFPDEPERPPLRLLQVSVNRPTLTGGGLPLHFNRMLIGEVLEDSATTFRHLAADPADGIGLLCVAVHEAQGAIYFDASRYWQRERTADGRLVLREVAVPADAPLPTFRQERHLTQTLTISCNCPSHTGLEFAKLLPGQLLGGQNLFPQRSPSGLSGPKRSSADGTPEGVRRRFALLPWERIPGKECKHCAAVRWALGCPMAEPTDMPSPDSDYWRDLAVMAQIEEGQGAMNDPQFLERLQANLLDEQAFSMLDITLLATCVGDAVGIVPQRVPLIPVQLAGAGGGTPFGGIAAFAGPLALQPRADLAALRLNEQHQSEDPATDVDAIFGDWWVGRGTSGVAFGLNGPGLVESSGPVMRPLPDGVDLPRVLP